MLRSIFAGDFSESPANREKAATVLDIYLRAVVGLVRERGWWESNPKHQRLYHNVGLHALLLLLDEMNGRANVFSAVTPGKINPVTHTEASRALQKVLKPIALLDWAVGVDPSGNGEGDLAVLKMSGIQQQKGIPGSLRGELLGLIDKAREVPRSEDPSLEITHDFRVQQSDGLVVCREVVTLSNTDSV